LLTDKRRALHNLIGEGKDSLIRAVVPSHILSTPRRSTNMSRDRLKIETHPDASRMTYMYTVGQKCTILFLLQQLCQIFLYWNNY